MLKEEILFYNKWLVFPGLVTKPEIYINPELGIHNRGGVVECCCQWLTFMFNLFFLNLYSPV